MRTYTWDIEQIETAVLKVINCSEASDSEIRARERNSVDCLPAEGRICQRVQSTAMPERKRLEINNTHAKSLSRNVAFAKVGNVLVSVASPITIWVVLGQRDISPM